MYLTLALARASGIPARGLGGYVYDRSTIAKSADYHNWAELYFEGRWRVVDAQKKIFDEKVADYVAMRIIKEADNDLRGNSHRFSIADNDLEIVMR